MLPVAIDLEIRVARRRRPDRHVRLASLASGEVAELDLDQIGPRTGGWVDYVAGTAREMAAAGLAIGGFDGVIGTTIPVAAGLSSSAALELAAAWALSGPAGPPADALTLARIAQRAENTYVGVMCGLMDQFASASGVAGAAVLLDCRSLDHRPVLLPAGLVLVVAYTGVPRTLGTSDYNARRADCERAVAALAAVEPGVRSLRDVDRTILERHADRLDPVARRRAEHVVDENLRVLATEAALRTGDLAALGRLFAASHASLRDRFEVSSPELDTLVEIAVGVPGVVASRMTGAGFGGCTLSLARPDAVDELRARILTDYPRRTGRTPRVWIVEAVDGAGFMSRPAALGRPDARTDLLTRPHRRRNPLTDEWILVSTDRIQRPLQGRSRGSRRPVPRAAYDPACYLCPGNVRANGERNPAYGETFVFTNDYAALRPDTSDDQLEIGLLRAEGERGTCRVICFSPRHDLDLARMSPANVRSIVDLWADQTAELGARSAGSRSSRTGARRWAPRTPTRTARSGPAAPSPSRRPGRTGTQRAPLRRRRATPAPRLRGPGARWPAGRRGERRVAGRRSLLGRLAVRDARRGQAPAARLADLATARATRSPSLCSSCSARYDNLFQHPFPYSMGWHQAPFDGGRTTHWQLHAHFQPPLLRSATCASSWSATSCWPRYSAT